METAGKRKGKKKGSLASAVRLAKQYDKTDIKMNIIALTFNISSIRT